MKILPFSDQFLDAAAQLLVEEYSENIAKTWTISKAKEYIKKNTDHFPEYCLVAIDNQDQYLGSLFCRVDPDYDGYLLYVDLLQVKDGYRNQGIAKALLQSAVKKAKRNHIRSIQLITDIRKDFPKSWYEKMGFKETGWVEYEVNLKDIHT